MATKWRGTGRISALGLILAAVMAVAPALAQEPRDHDNAGARERATEVMARAVRAYSEAATYQHLAVESTEMTGVSELEPAIIAEDARKPCQLFFKRPNRILVQCDNRRLVYDGRRLWEYNSLLEQYTVAEVRTSADPSAFINRVAEHSTLLMPHAIVVAYLLGDEQAKLARLTAWEDEVQVWVTSESLAGQDGTRIVMEAGADGSTGSYWYSAATGLLEEVRLQLEIGAQDMPEQPLAHLVTRYEQVSVDGEISDEVFSFEPGPDDTEVERFATHPGMVSFIDPEDRNPPQPTVSVADGSLQDLATERLRIDSRTLARVRGARHADVDGDGTDELIIPMERGGLTWLSTDGGEPTQVDLQLRAPMLAVRAIEPVRLQGSLHWLLTFEEHGALVMAADAASSGQPPLVAAGLYDASGREVWYYQPELPQGTTARILTSHGDLSGDGVAEVVLGLALTSYRQSGRSEWSVVNERCLVVILDAAGERLAQKSFDRGLVQLMVEPSQDRSAPARVFCLLSASRRAGGTLEYLTLTGGQ